MSQPSIRVREVRFRVLNMRTRMPFRYGIASLRALPHLFVEVDAEYGGRRVRGLTAEGLPPKWFTKDPTTRFEEDLVGMLAAIRSAAGLAVELGAQPGVFAWWTALHDAQAVWGSRAGVASLLSGLGTSLLERAVIDGVCRVAGTSFPRALRGGLLGIELSRIHPELGGMPLVDLLPAAPAEQIQVRHTVGLSDPLEDGEIQAGERLADGLPQSLAAAVKRYGLTHFKVKLCGDAERDLARLRRIGEVLTSVGVGEPVWTLDGNEQFGDLGVFRRFWERMEADAGLHWLRAGLQVVEQPLHRDAALSDETGRDLRAWEDRPALIVDESDGEPRALRRALELGYAGISHKNCKGVFRGVANACLLRLRREKEPSGGWVMTSEDLATVGPVAMLQDLCVASCLGLRHSERNGHHYFRGLSMYDGRTQAAVLAAHADLYEPAVEGGFPTLRIRRGGVSTASVLAAPFGCGADLDVSGYPDLEQWSPESLGLERE